MEIFLSVLTIIVLAAAVARLVIACKELYDVLKKKK